MRQDLRIELFLVDERECLACARRHRNEEVSLPLADGWLDGGVRVLLVRPKLRMIVGQREEVLAIRFEVAPQ